MQYREFGRTGWSVSTISFGAWAIGGTWSEGTDELRRLVAAGMTLTQMALRWLLMSPAVTCAIPGAKCASQVEENVRAADLPALPKTIVTRVGAIYDRRVRPQVHHYW